MKTKNTANTTVETATAVAEQTAPQTAEATADVPPATVKASPARKASAAKPVETRVFTLTGVAFSPGKGLATALFETMQTMGSATAQQATDVLLASGAYQKAAPQAAKLRPLTPVTTLLKQWLDKGVVSATEAGA